ncbi:MAG TPA: radical SAM protein [bacterium]|nr:radical SAM protein [bacterium]
MKLQLILKLSKLCNLRCVYCYEYDELGQKERMSLESLDALVRSVGDVLERSGKYESVEFTLHGGEPLLLPQDYLQGLCELPAKHLAPRRLKYSLSCQSNLYKLSDATLQWLKDYRISLGVSLDIAGDQRVTITGENSQGKVLDNVQRLIDARIPFGAITVLHAQNMKDALKVYRFYNELGMDYRILPIFSQDEGVPERMRHLMISREQALNMLKIIAIQQLHSPSRIKVSPLYEYLVAATLYLLGRKTVPFDPREGEWTLVVNTNGDTYNIGDQYQPEGYIGNAFRQGFEEILASPERGRSVATRLRRMGTCLECPYDSHCSRIPMVEALESERSYREDGALRCGLARPMIEFLVDEIRRSKVGGKLIDETLALQPSV